MDVRWKSVDKWIADSWKIFFSNLKLKFAPKIPIANKPY